MPNRAPVMNGGGSKGAIELGALDYVVQRKHLAFQVIAGVSTGSRSAIMSAQEVRLERLSQWLERVKEILFGISSGIEE